MLLCMWGNPDERNDKKIYRIGKSAAYSIGGGLGTWEIMLFYPPSRRLRPHHRYIMAHWLALDYLWHCHADRYCNAPQTGKTGEFSFSYDCYSCLSLLYLCE